MDDLLTFNGIDAVSGNYLLPPISPELFSKAIQGTELDPKEIQELKNWHFAKTQAHLGLKEGDPIDLAQAGWGVIFPSAGDPSIRQALIELLDWRHEQASRVNANYYKEFNGEAGYQTNESKLGWLARHGMGPGPAEPEKVPYYLLLVGDPSAIPYRFQTQLDVQYATGRIYFDRLEDYANYAHSVVEVEKRQIARARTITFFGVSNPDDPSTNLSAAQLVKPLAEDTARDHSDWLVRSIPIEETTKHRLSDLIGGTDTPSLLFTASHGMAFPNGHPLQIRRQGALLTQDWPGPKNYHQPIPEDFYFSGDDVGDDARVLGMLAFIFACFGAGTPEKDEFSQAAFKDTQAQLAPKPFLAALPMRLLAHPHGSALALVGHVDRAWGYSFYWGKAESQLGVFERALSLLLKGYPIGAAIDPFNIRYAELSSDLNSLLDDIQWGKKYEPRELAGMWTANNDARNYVIIGDPAVRLSAAVPGTKPTDNLEITPIELANLQPATGQDEPDAQTMTLSASEVISAIQRLGRLYSYALDDSYLLPVRESITIGRRDPASGNYPDIDLGNQGEVSASVSRKHARINVQGIELFIEDLNSRNFTYLNGKKLEPGQRYPLKQGDELRLGSVLLVFLAH